MNYSKYIDHSLLHPTSTLIDLEKLCAEAIEFDVAAVCVKPDSVKIASHLLVNSGIQVATVIGFPHGSNTTPTKCYETSEAIANGATEIDMVVNISKVLESNWEYVANEIQCITDVCRNKQVIIKVIFETAYLSEFHIIKLCEICSQIQVDFVKTSTGFDFVKQNDGKFSTVGARIEDIIIMKSNISENVKIKASGGIRDSHFFMNLINNGASRIGTSATKDILKELI